jgi:hypothetical protein
MAAPKHDAAAPAATLEQDRPPATAAQTAATEQAMGLSPAQPARVPARIGIAPQTLEEGWRLAQMMARSELVPKSFRGHPEDVLVAIQMGVEIGFAPMQALQSIAVINGRPSVWGDGLLALLMAAPVYKDHDEYYEVDGERREDLTVEDLKKDQTCAVCTFWRHGKATPTTRRFSIGKAKKAGLLGKEGPWQTHPDRMLQMRARGFAGRDTFPDVLRGMRAAEEVRDLPEEEAAPIVVREVTRKSATPPPAAPPEVDAIVHLGPLGVTDVQTFMGGFTVTLSDGTTVDTTEASDAVDLEAFKGTPHKVRLQATRVGETLQLQTFTLAE